MKKNNYSAPKMEQVKMEAETSVMLAGSGATTGNLASFNNQWSK